MYTVNFNPSPAPRQAYITSFLPSCIHTSWFVNYSSNVTSSFSIIIGLSYTFKITKLINYLKKISKMYGYLEKATCRTAYVVCRHLSWNRRKEKHTHTYFLDGHINYLWQIHKEVITTGFWVWEVDFLVGILFILEDCVMVSLGQKVNTILA